MQLPNIEKYNNLFIIRLIKGEIPLVITYWIFGILGLVLFTFIDKLLIANAISIFHSGYGFVFTLYKLVFYPYLFIIWISIWNSARKYKRFLWGTFAQFMVVIGVFNFLASVLNDDKYKVGMQIAEINKSLPITIEPGLDLVSISIDDNSINYNYRVLNANFTQKQLVELRVTLNDTLKQRACTDDESFEMLKVFGSAHYVYSDEQSNSLVDIPVSIRDCSSN